MLPDMDDYEDDLDEITDEMEELVIPDKTYNLNYASKRIEGLIDESDARAQAITKSLITEAEEYAVYDPGYGMIVSDLIGMPMNYAVSEIKDRIEETLLQDDRFDSVTFTDVQIDKRSVALLFTVHCADGEDIAMKGVNIDV